MLDKWGLPFFYPSKQDGFIWFQKDDISKDEHFHEDNISSSGGGSFTVHFSGPTSPDILTDPDAENNNLIGGCNMDFGATEKRGYSFKSNDPRDIELKMILKVESASGGHGLSLSGPSGNHSGSGCCSGFTYMITCEFDQSPPTFRFRKEMWHVSYHTDPKTGEWTHPKANFKWKGHGNVGYGYVRYNRKDGVSAGHDSVVLECWFNPDPDDDPVNGWVMLKRTEDKGGWGDDGGKCNGDKDQIGTWAGPKFRIKSNDPDADITFKHLSLREIDPTASFDDNPPDDSGGGTSGGGSGDVTSTDEIKGLLTLKRDINVYRTSACSPSGSVPFYTSAVNHTTDSGVRILGAPSGAITRTAIGMIAVDSQSMLVNQPPLLEVDLYLTKVGSPTGTANVVIRSGSSDTLKATMDTIDVSTIDTTETLYQFINLSNTYQIQPQNKILIEWSGGDESNHVLVAVKGVKTATDSHTNAIFWDSVTSTYTQWTNREVSGKLLN